MTRYIVRSVAIASTICGAVYAEDIEIFQPSLIDDIEDANPNILFIMDTSGSMRRSTAVAFGNYDPDIDYGDSDDDAIFVFNSNFTFQNIELTREQFVCETGINFIDSTPTLPLYSGRAVQWNSETTDESAVCPTQTLVDTNVISDVVGRSVDNQLQILIPRADLVAGSAIELGISSLSQAQGAAAGQANSVTADLGFYWLNASGNLQSSFTCSSAAVTVGTTGGCLMSNGDQLEVDNIPATMNGFDVIGAIARVRTPLNADSNDESDVGTGGTELFATISGEVRFNVREEQVDPTCVPGGPVNTGDWQSDLFVPANADEVVECQDDAGTHGISNASLATFAAFCPDDNCTQPNYSTTGPGINFTQNGIQSFFFVSGNFRDYLTSQLNETPDVVVNNPEAYCAGSINRAGDFVEEASTGAIFQCMQRGAIMQQAATTLVSTLDNVNIGLMRFENNGQGGTITLDIGSVSDDNGEQQRQDFIEDINQLQFGGTTPLAETLYEAHRYFSGQPEDFSRPNSVIPNRDPSVFVPGTENSSRIYQSPIEHACQSNNIVLLTDGQPIGDNDEDQMEALVRSLAASIDNPPLADTICNDNGSGTADNCLDELAAAMARYDHSGVIDGVNNVNLFTVGFTIDLPLLDRAADLGGGEYFLAGDALELQRAFQQIIVQIEDAVPASLVAPAVSVNAFNELQHRDDLYYAVFEPASSPRWEGNVKRYRIDDGDILDANDAVAIDDNTGLFIDSSQSVWSDQVDGANVVVGGMREQLTQNRRIFVDGEVLTAPQPDIVRLGTDTEFIPAAAGVASALEAQRVRDWLLGRDVDDENEDGNLFDANRYAGHSLHSQPFVVTYEGSNVDDARDVLFVPTNQGLLHAIDARPDFGTEMWAYLPGSQTGNLVQYLDNDPTASHVYGLDGESTLFIEEDLESDNFEVDTVHIYQGMRRGGRNYYGWDVSDALSQTQVPIETLWEIRGGEGGFDELGQTWSQMISTSILYGCDEDGSGCTSRDVLIFSGGYDTFYDDEGVAPITGSSNVLGNSIYMIDRESGQLLWSAGDSADGHNLGLEMFNSIPATPAIIDNDSDDHVDIIFAIDVAGNLFRIDFNEMASSPNDPEFSQGGTIAEINDGQPRRFYNEIDVSLSAPRGEIPFFNLSVGSGYRAHPRDENEGQNALFVVYDDFVFSPQDANDDGVYEYDYHPDGTVSFGAGHLFRTTEDEPADRDVNAEFGFYIPLDFANEKILQRTTTLNGIVVVSSYIPNNGAQVSENICGQGNIGGGRIYAFDLATGATLIEDELISDGIPPEPSFLFPDDAGLAICVGTECGFDDGSDDENGTGTNDESSNNDDALDRLARLLSRIRGTAERTYWRQN